MRLLHSPVLLVFSIAALTILVLSAVTWEYLLEWAEGVISFALLFFLISSVMKTKHLIVSSGCDHCADIGTLLL
ncbi:hypothetical protein [Gloeothece verrucosa]|nr:hypothetical protein [Gloeothece verrucosa]